MLSVLSAKKTTTTCVTYDPPQLNLPVGFYRNKVSHKGTDKTNNCLFSKYDISDENNLDTEEYWRVDNLHTQEESPSRGLRVSVRRLFKISHDREQYSFTKGNGDS